MQPFQTFFLLTQLFFPEGKFFITLLVFSCNNWPSRLERRFEFSGIRFISTPNFFPGFPYACVQYFGYAVYEAYIFHRIGWINA